MHSCTKVKPCKFFVYDSKAQRRATAKRRRQRWTPEDGEAAATFSRKRACAAMRVGRTGGAKLTEDDHGVAKTLLANPDIAVADAADRIGVSPATLYRYLPRADGARPPAVICAGDRFARRLTANM